MKDANIKTVFRITATILLPPLIAIVLVTTTVRFAVGSLPMWMVLFEQNRVAANTGIALDELYKLGEQFQAYFRSNTKEPLRVEAPVYGVRQPLFNDKEVAHMKDVKQAFRITFKAQVVTAMLAIIALASARLVWQEQSTPMIGRWLKCGALATAVFVVAIGLLSVVAFGPLFTLFHQVLFRNDFWLLDPSTDMLVRIFPFGFWRDMTIAIGVLTLLMAGLVYLVGKWLANVDVPEPEPTPPARKEKGRTLK